MLSGCVTRQVYFPKPAVPVRLGQDLKGVHVFVPDGNGKLIQARADLFKGQWVITHPDDWDDNARREYQHVAPAK